MKQIWFKTYIKGFLKRQAKFESIGALKKTTQSLRRLSSFIDHSYPDHKINGFRDFSREFFLDFIDWIFDPNQNFGIVAKQTTLSDTLKLIEDCVERDVLDAQAFKFIRKSDYKIPYNKKKNIRVIDQYV